MSDSKKSLIFDFGVIRGKKVVKKPVIDSENPYENKGKQAVGGRAVFP
jgi:hypothetical protein